MSHNDNFMVIFLPELSAFQKFKTLSAGPSRITAIQTQSLCVVELPIYFNEGMSAIYTMECVFWSASSIDITRETMQHSNIDHQDLEQTILYVFHISDF